MCSQAGQGQTSCSWVGELELVFFRRVDWEIDFRYRTVIDHYMIDG